MTCPTSETQRRAHLIRIGAPCLYCVLLLCVAGNCTGKETPQRELVPSEQGHQSGYRHAGGAVAVKPQNAAVQPARARMLTRILRFSGTWLIEELGSGQIVFDKQEEEKPNKAIAGG